MQGEVWEVLRRAKKQQRQTTQKPSKTIENTKATSTKTKKHKTNPPQQKKQKEHKILLEAIKKGDEILTSGGIIAKVTKAEGEKLNVDIAPNVNVVVYRSTVADVINKK